MVLAARAAGGRVIAVGTTVVRAIEGATADGGGLLRAFAPDEALQAALDHAGGEGYLSHEFGDAMVVI